MDERARRIVETAIALAERDGFGAVRLRDVAATANVALGTVYKRFASKEEILIAALELESEKVSTRFGNVSPPGETPKLRARFFFQSFTRGLLRKDKLASALIRALSSGDPKVSERVVSFHSVITLMVIAAIRGVPAASQQEWGGSHDEPERKAAFILQQVWYASVIGWSGGIHDDKTVMQHVEIVLDALYGPG